MSNVSLEVFAQRFARAVLLVEVDPNARLADLQEFDSMGRIAASTMIEDTFGFQISYDILQGDQTLTQLYSYCLDNSVH